MPFSSYVFIFGHILWNGTVSQKGYAMYCNKSLKLVKEFAIKAEEIFKGRKIKIYYKRRIFRVRIWSRPFVRVFLKLTQNKKTIPKFIFYLEKNHIRNFLRTFWDDEGYISNRGEIYGYISSEDIAKGLKRLHKMLGIEVLVYKRKNGYILYVPKGFIKKFASEIGFSEYSYSYRGGKPVRKKERLENFIKALCM